MTNKNNSNKRWGQALTTRHTVTKWAVWIVVAILLFMCVATVVIEANFAVNSFKSAMEASKDNASTDVSDDGSVTDTDNVVDNTNGALNDGSASTSATTGVTISSQINGNLGTHYKWDRYVQSDDGDRNAYQIVQEDGLPVLEKATQAPKTFELGSTNPATMAQQWIDIINYATGKSSSSPANFKTPKTYAGATDWNQNRIVDITTTGSYNVNQYVHVKLTSDWNATYKYTRNGEEVLWSNETYFPIGWPYMSFSPTQTYDHYEFSQPFVYGGINVPSGAYIMLDLNGHTIDRRMYTLLQEWRSMLVANNKSSTNRGGTEWGWVMSVSPLARLEIYDSTATESADVNRIGQKTTLVSNLYNSKGNVDLSTYSTNHKGTIMGGMSDITTGGIRDQAKGGAIHNNPCSEIIIHSGTIAGCCSSLGGAMYQLQYAGNLIFDGYFAGNVSGGQGGCVYLANNCQAVYTQYGGVFYDNYSGTNGGVVALSITGFGYFFGGRMQNNRAYSYGGAIYIGERATGVLRNCVITGNACQTNYGGAIYKAISATNLKFYGALKVYDNYKKQLHNPGAGVDPIPTVVQNVYLPSGSKIPIGGPMLDNGDAAYVGVTMADGIGTFTSDYGKYNTISPTTFFFSDVTTNHVDYSTDTTYREGKIATGTVTNYKLTWHITGVAIDNKGGFNNDGDSAIANAKARTIVVDNVSATFSYKLLRITKVEAKFRMSYGQQTAASWSIDPNTGEVKSSYMETSFKFKTANSVATNQQIQNVGTTGYKGLEYAGQYSFIVNTGSTYDNQCFTINILQTGLRAEINQYKDGTKLASGDNLTYQGVAIPQLDGLVAGRTGFNYKYYYSNSALAALFGSSEASDLLNYGGVTASIMYSPDGKNFSSRTSVLDAGTYNLSLHFANSSTVDIGVDPVGNNYTFDGSSTFQILPQNVRYNTNITSTYNGLAQKPVTFTPHNDKLSTAVPSASDYRFMASNESNKYWETSLKNAATYTNLSIALIDSVNFRLVDAKGNFVILSPKDVKVVINPLPIEVEWIEAEKRIYTYDGEAHAPTATLKNRKGSDSYRFTYSGAQVSATQSGKVTITGIDNTNYTLTGVASATLSCAYKINPLPVEISWDKLEFTYNGEQQNPKGTVKNAVVSGLSKDVISVEVVAEESIWAGDYDYMVEAVKLVGEPEVLNNYTLVGGKNIQAYYKIKALTLDLKFDNLALVYDGTAQVPNVTASNILGSDNVTIKVTVPNASKDVGNNYKAVITLGGRDWGNYALPELDETEDDTEIYKIFSIVPRPVVITWEDDGVDEDESVLSHVYNGQEWAPTPIISNLCEADRNANITLEVDMKHTDVGNYTVRVSKISSDNYTLTEGTDTAADYKITAMPLELSWSGSTIFTYDGRTEWCPHVAPKSFPRDEIELIITGKSMIAGKFVAKVTGYRAKDETSMNNYSFDSTAEDTEMKFEVKPILAIFDWGTPEDRVVEYSRSVVTPRNVKILNLVEGDTCRIVFEGGQTDAGENIPISIKGLSSTNYTIVMEGESYEYNGETITAEEYEANLYNTYTITPKVVTAVWVVEEDNPNYKYTYDGQEHAPRARLEGVIHGDSCVAVYSENSKKTNVGTHIAEIVGVSNPNYKLAEDETYEQIFEIVAKVVTVKWEYTEAYDYNGFEQSVIAKAEGLAGEDELEFIYENNRFKDAGKYTAKILDVANGGNYTIDLENAPELEWEIKAIAITVDMRSVDKMASLATDGSKFELKNWYSFTTTGLVGEDIGKSITSLFEVNMNALTLMLIGSNGTAVADNNVTQAGEYVIRFTITDAGKVLTNNGNYITTVLNKSAGKYGTLYVTADAVKGLEIINVVEIDGETVIRQYDFLYEEVEDEYTSYRRTYTEMGFTHGLDDKDFERIILGQVAPETSVYNFLKAFAENLHGQIKLYNAEGDLIFDCGQPGAGYSEDDLADPYTYSVGTGWKIEYGEEEIYISVLGDLTGDGFADNNDAAVMGEFLMYIREASEETVEIRLAAYFANLGYIDQVDGADLDEIAMYMNETSAYFYKVTEEEA